MFGEWSPLAWVVITFLALLWLKGWVGRHVQGIGLLLSGSSEGGIIFYFLLFLPGIVVHELSHWLAAKLLLVRTGKISVWPGRKRGGKMQLGSVEVGPADPFRASIIGLAPLVSGSLIIFFIGGAFFRLEGFEGALRAGDLGQIWQVLSSYFRVPDFWLWLYVVFAISNAMLPSETDRRPWRSALAFLGILAAFFVLSGWVPHIPPSWARAFLNFLGYLAYTFGLTVVVDLIFMLIITLLENLMVVVRGMRVEY
ncbi:MAG: hypothetical protein ACUVV0_08270 [Anaerolineae bacterium]